MAGPGEAETGTAGNVRSGAKTFQRIFNLLLLSLEGMLSLLFC